jgi:predicted permease
VLLVSLDTIRRAEANEHNTALMQILERLKTVPGVEQVSAAEYGLLGRAWTHGMRLPGTQYEAIESTMAPVTHGFFETMQIKVLAGRPFVSTDLDPKKPGPVIVNEAFATRYYGRASAVGGTFEARFGEHDDGGIQEVVGVVADTRYDLRKPAAPTMYIPLRPGRSSSIYVRVTGDAAALGSRLREEVRAAGSVFRVTTVRAQSALVEQTLIRERLLALLSGFFAAVGLVLAAVGLYAVLSYSVAQRTREIGIRVALGARQMGVVRTVLGDASGAALAGAICGLAGGLYLSRFVETLLFEVKPLEFWSLALPLGALLLTAAIAVAFPALRAARVDPVVALRYE